VAVPEYATVAGKLDAIVVDYTDADTHPDETIVSAFCDFNPRLKAGTVLWCPDLTPPRGLAIAPIAARFDAADGQLKTIVDSPVELLACNDALPIDELIYDVVFSEVRYAKREQYIAPFALRMPTATATINLVSVEGLPALDGLKPLVH
jgi:hypothetical protein